MVWAVKFCHVFAVWYIVFLTPLYVLTVWHYRHKIDRITRNFVDYINNLNRLIDV